MPAAAPRGRPSLVADRAGVAAIWVRQGLALAVAQAAIHGSAVVAWQWCRELVAFCRAVARGAAFFRKREVAADAVAILRHAKATAVAARPRGLVALFARVLLVAGGTTAAIDRRAQTVGA